ncbi:hypothetical protein BH11PLA2_BH11PLA2_06420 [soil metagenome]
MNRIIIPLVFGTLALGCDAGRPMPPLPPKAVNVSESNIKELQQGTANTAVAAGAKAGQQMVSAGNPPEVLAAPVKVEVNLKRETVTPSKAGPVIRVANIRSDKPQATREKAITDALQVAQYEIVKQLKQLEPPVTAKPSLTAIRHEYLKGNSVREVMPDDKLKEDWKANRLDPNRMWVEIDVELTESQVQQLRSRDRIDDGFRGASILFALVLTVYGFLRLDAFTKGYLTLWLAIAAVAIVGFVAAGLLW